MLVGAGGHAVGVAEAATLSGWRVAAYVDSRPAAWLDDYGNPDHIRDDECAILAAAAQDLAVALGLGGVTPGALATRLALLDRYRDAGIAAAVINHPSAVVSRTASVAEGVTLLAGAMVQPYARLGGGAIVNSGAVVEHHAEIGEGAHIGPGAVVLGGARIGARALIGANAVVLPGAVVEDGGLVKATGRFG